MSSLDSSMNSMSTACITDFYRRLRGGSDEGRCLRLARGLTAIFAITGALFAMLMVSSDIKSLWHQFIFIVGLMGGGLGGLFVHGIFTRRANAQGAVIELLTSGILQYLFKRHCGLHNFVFALTGMASCVVVGYLASLLPPRGGKNLQGLTLYTRSPESGQQHLG